MKRLWVTPLILLVGACSAGAVGIGPAVTDGGSVDGGLDGSHDGAVVVDAASDAAVDADAPPDAAVDAEVLPDAAGPYCGDGVIDPDEDCDGPQNLGGMDCVSLGYDEGILACDNCAFDTSGCSFTGPYCGDGVINGFEACDGNDHGGLDCAALGFDFGALHCGPSCVFDTSGCGNHPPPCGDGFCDWQTGTESVANCPLDCGCNPVTGFGCAPNEACVVDTTGGIIDTICILAGTSTYLCSPFTPCRSGYVCTAQAQCAQYCDHNNPGTCPAPQTCQSSIPHNGENWGYCFD